MSTTVDPAILRPQQPPSVPGVPKPGPPPADPAGWPVIAAVGGTALTAAVVIRWNGPGVGWLITGLVAAILVPVAAHRQRGAGALSARAWAWRLVWTVLALGLLATGAVRAAGWLWVLCVPAAIGCAVLALVDPKTVQAMGAAVVSIPAAIIRGVPWVARGLVRLRLRAGTSPVRIAASLAATVGVIAVFGALFAGADAVFARIVTSVLPTVDGKEVVVRGLTFVGFGLAAVGACVLAISPFGDSAQQSSANVGDAVAPAGLTVSALTEASAGPRRVLRRFEWVLPIGSLVALSAVFVGVQATVMFGGGEHVLRTDGLTYAEYARQGFWQLLAVSVLTLIMIAIVARLAERDTAADRGWLRAVLGSLSLLSLVIVASSVSRMLAYTDAYGLTRLRVMVLACEAWLGLIFVLILLAGLTLVVGVRLSGSWLARVGVAAAATILVGIAVVNPDLIIAQQNVDRYERIGRIDLAYLSGLSVDALPALEQLPDRERQCVLSALAGDARADHGPGTWNWSRERARVRLAGVVPGSCGSSLR